MMPGYPAKVRMVEVGPRDGLQNEAQALSLADKMTLIQNLAAAGLRYIEAGSFVSPKWVPQMADSDTVLRAIRRQANVTYAALVPNMQGYAAARAADADEIAVFTAASETFSQKNINCSIAESLDRFAPVMAAAKADGLPVRGYISCVLGCPYEGEVSPDAVADVAVRLLNLGCREISLGDTIGVGTPAKAQALIHQVAAGVPRDRLAVHFHDTYGQALANIYASLEKGIAVVDSSVAGLGGCPYAKGATGNVASEDVLYLLNGLGIDTGVDLTKLVTVGRWISQRLGRENHSKVGQALPLSVPEGGLE